jgi:hypothetical protein
MKKIFDVRHIIIAILLLLAIVILINPKGIMPNRTVTIRDTVGFEVPVHDTIPQEVEVEVEVPVEVEIEKLVPYAVHDTVAINNPIDTNAILNAVGQKIFKKDILKLPSNVGTVTLFDTISNNRIVGRSFKSDVKQKIVRDTIFTPIPRQNEMYVGFDAKIDKPNVINIIGVGVLFKNKDDRHLYKLGIGVTNRVDDQGTNGKLVPFIGGGAYWKIKSKK